MSDEIQSIGSDTREVSFYRAALFAPGALHLVLLFTPLKFMVLFTAVYGAVPYVVLLLATLSWARDKSAAQFRRRLLVLPLGYVAAFWGFLFLLSMSEGVSSFRNDMPMLIRAMGLLGAVALGYACLWVLLILAGWKLVPSALKAG